MITKHEIKEMSYTDFVGFMNQWNVLPGAYTTLSKWAAFAHIDSKSRILELACTSGFSSRELSVLTGCSGIGLDISVPSIEMANYNRDTYTPDAKIEYLCANANDFQTKEKFSHVVVGAALKFFPNQEETIQKIVTEYLIDGGHLLASPFYVTKAIPNDLVKRAKEVFDITITTEDYHEVMKTYQGFEVVYEDRQTIVQETEDELKHYCTSTVERACAIRTITDKEVIEAMYERLMKIKRMSNDLRPYQMYSVLVLRYRSKVYPNRYIELF